MHSLKKKIEWIFLHLSKYGADVPATETAWISNETQLMTYCTQGHRNLLVKQVFS